MNSSNVRGEPRALGVALLLQLLLYLLQSLVLMGAESVFPSQTAVKMLSLFTVTAVFMLPTALYLRMTGVSLRDIFRMKHRESGKGEGGWLRQAVFFVFAAAIILNAANLAGMATDAVTAALGISLPDNTPSSDTSMLILNLISSVLLAPFLEELLFRGVVMDALRGESAEARCLISGLLFGLMHYELYRFFYAFVAGTLIAYFALNAGSLRFAVGLHAVNNLITFISSLAGEAFDIAVLAVSLPIAVICAVLILKKRGEKAAPGKADGESVAAEVGNAKRGEVSEAVGIVIYCTMALTLTVLSAFL